MVSSLFKRVQNVEHCSYNGDDFVQMLLYEKSVSFFLHIYQCDMLCWYVDDDEFQKAILMTLWKSR